jgi:nitrilase
MIHTKVAAAQFFPEYGNLENGVDKAVSIIEAAAKKDVQLLVFPELWFIGYPYWASMDTRSPDHQFWLHRFLEEAGQRDDPRLDPLYEAAKLHSMSLSFSIHERAAGSLYNTLMMINSFGDLALAHRKLMPTNTERLIHGQGAGNDIAAMQTKIGNISGLLCFEHQMTLARAAVGMLEPVVHCAQWPGHEFLNPIIDASVRQLAHENACFVICARELMNARNIGERGPVGNDETRWVGVGGSSISAPNARYIVHPVFEEEQLVISELPLEEINKAKYLIDNQGHYGRPDVFQFSWKRSGL